MIITSLNCLSVQFLSFLVVGGPQDYLLFDLLWGGKGGSEHKCSSVRSVEVLACCKLPPTNSNTQRARAHSRGTLAHEHHLLQCPKQWPFQIGICESEDVDPSQKHSLCQSSANPLPCGQGNSRKPIQFGRPLLMMTKGNMNHMQQPLASLLLGTKWI